jgi:uncharacterized RmlC-like cupin family protein
LWAGTMVVQPDAKTGPHHHGELETVLYVVKGRIRMRWGDQLELSEVAAQGAAAAASQMQLSRCSSKPSASSPASMDNSNPKTM